ncbi:MAG: hypothetical protein ACE5I7_19825, partial [Candidatus Binatia bacterium]
ILIISSNGDVRIRLDNDGGEEGVLRVRNSGGQDVCTITEQGNLTCTGTVHGQGVFGVRGESDAGIGVFGTSTGNVAGQFESTNWIGLAVFADSAGRDIIRGYGASGASDVEFRVENDGDVRADGSFAGGGTDYADMVPVDGEVSQYEPGDVLVIGPRGRLVLSRAPYTTAVAGVYSTKPGFIGGNGADGAIPGSIPLALAGVVPVKVSAENGPIVPGDLLTTSSVAGHAMKAVNPAPGTILGKALGRLETGTGVVDALVVLQ